MFAKKMSFHQKVYAHLTQLKHIRPVVGNVHIFQLENTFQNSN